MGAPAAVCLAGTLPAAWSALFKLSMIRLNMNRLEGTLPASWSGMAALTELRLDLNRLQARGGVGVLVVQQVPGCIKPSQARGACLARHRL